MRPSNDKTEDTPELSVVIASVNGVGLDECLQALERQTARGASEFIVVDCCGNGVSQLVRRRHPGVKLLSLQGRHPIPELRAIGIKHSRGRIITLTEDHCLADPHWCERILRAHQARYGAIGGAVENEGSIKRIVDWAVFFCEYSRYMNPIGAGEAEDLPGNNVSYRREFLTHIADLLTSGSFWESSFNERLRANGIGLYSDPSIIVYHKKHFGVRCSLSQRYHYSRSFAGMRARDWPWRRRLLFATLSPLLPAVVIARISWRVVRKQRFLGKFVQAFPLVLLLSAVWAVGEFVGYWLGPGESLIKVE